MIPERPVTIGVAPRLDLEGALAAPPMARSGVVVCHPHPLYGGDMDNPVVLTTVQACSRAGLATLRFNFRGAGASGGAWDEGRGERADVAAALSLLRTALPAGAGAALAGYSFGAAMAAALAGTGERLAGLALIAPPLAMRPWQPAALPGVKGPILLIAGDADQYCPRAALEALGHALPQADLRLIDGTDHFFFMGLERLEDALEAWAAAVS